ncbi:MAG: hypothetical protein WBN04_12765 [Paracoccaceae bacterium]
MKSLIFISALAVSLTQALAQEAAGTGQSFDELFTNSVNEDLAREAEEAAAIEAARPTQEEYAAGCAAKGALAAKAVINSKGGVALEQTQAEIWADPEVPEGLTQLGSDMMVTAVYDYMSGMAPADVSALIEKQCLIR